jgi:hypothetical protein
MSYTKVNVRKRGVSRRAVGIVIATNGDRVSVRWTNGETRTYLARYVRAA